MSLSVNFDEAELGGMALAQVGNPLKDEGLRTSKNLCGFDNDEAELLTHCFLKPFRALEVHRLSHPSGLESNPLFRSVAAIFEDTGRLLPESGEIARHLYSRSRHPQIKSGDLCIALLHHLLVNGERVNGLSIIKSENKVPFLQVTSSGEDLQLKTQQGIYPDKIDKGCLILDHGKADGYAVYLFDKSGNTQFWNREFVNAAPVRDEDFLTRRYSEMCLAFAKAPAADEAMQEERVDVARKAVSYLAEADTFDIEDFNRVALAEPEVSRDFQEFREAYEEESIGVPLDDNFVVSKKEARKAERKLKSRLSLDVGVDMKFSSGFQKAADQFMEKGFDEDKQMKYIKIYYHAEG